MSVPHLVDDQLRTLLAIVDDGSFEGAAYELGITPSAVSQRVKALERRTGQVLVRRTNPCTATPAGAVLVRAARQMLLVEADAAAGLAPADGERTRLAVAVNADSLATWFEPVLAEAAGWADCTLSLAVEDQDHSARLLRDGEVLAAVTSQAAPVAGCTSEVLGAMRYVPVATPAFLAAHTRGGVLGPSDARGLRSSGASAGDLDLREAPVVRFNAKDDLQHRFLARLAPDVAPPVHLVPSSQAFLAAVRAGLGWGMLPEPQLGDDLRTGRLVVLAPDGAVDVPLHWQSWRLASERLDRLGAAVRAAARGLRAPSS